MAFFAPQNEREMELLKQNGGNSASTIKKKENVLRQFKQVMSEDLQNQLKKMLKI